MDAGVSLFLPRKGVLGINHLSSVLSVCSVPFTRENVSFCESILPLKRNADDVSLLNSGHRTFNTGFIETVAGKDFSRAVEQLFSGKVDAANKHPTRSTGSSGLFMRGHANRSPNMIDDDNGYRSMGSIFADAVSADYGVAVANVASNNESDAFSPFRFENSVRPKIQASGSVIADLGMFMCRPASSSPDLFGVASATVIAWRDGDHTTLMAYGVAVPNKAVGLHRIGISSADRGNSGCLSLGPHNGGKATPTRSHPDVHVQRWLIGKIRSVGSPDLLRDSRWESHTKGHAQPIFDRQGLGWVGLRNFGPHGV